MQTISSDFKEIYLKSLMIFQESTDNAHITNMKCLYEFKVHDEPRGYHRATTS